MNKISELMDGELDPREAQHQLRRIQQDQDLARRWHTFHLIGDSIRGERALSHGFDQRLSARLAGEPTVLAPRRSTLKRATTFALSAAASLSAVALVGWLAFVNNSTPPQPEIATAPIPATALPPSPQLASLPSDGNMNEYLIAHQEYSPSTALQGLAPYIRSVSTTQQVQGR